MSVNQHDTGRVYLLNASVFLGYGLFSHQPITTEKAKEILKNAKEVISTVGHESTAKAMSKLLGKPVPVNRIFTTMVHGDKAIALRMLVRLEEGKIMSIEEIGALPYELTLIKSICRECPEM